jgi:hypothetical protein
VSLAEGLRIVDAAEFTVIHAFDQHALAALLCFQGQEGWKYATNNLHLSIGDCLAASRAWRQHWLAAATARLQCWHASLQQTHQHQAAACEEVIKTNTFTTFACVHNTPAYRARAYAVDLNVSFKYNEVHCQAA